MTRVVLAIAAAVSLVCGDVRGAAAAMPASLAPSVEQALADLSSDEAAVRDAAANVLIETGDPTLLPRLEELRSTADRRLRLTIKPIGDLLKNKGKLSSPAAEERRSAAADLGMLGRPVAIAWMQHALQREPDRWVRYTLEESINLIQLSNPDAAVQAAAARNLGSLHSQNAVPALKDLSGGSNQEAATASRRAIEQIESWGAWVNGIETIFRGISLSSILLIMSLGLAIVFGLMGVINMAHGELMMVGAYATYVTQEVFRAHVSPDLFDSYFLAAMPVAFLAAAAFGMLLEATVIRHLYGRPLETMLATWGVSLVFIQAARVYFGDLTSVAAPGWLSGGFQMMVGVYLPYNRLFIIALSILCVLGIYVLLFRSALGLRVRAVMQNRNMSACLGIPTRKVDAYTFAFGSGLAGIAGWALTLIGNVDPGLGQNYIVDSFMVVVTGGVGKLAGTIVAALGIGSLNKLLEPSFGAVYGKVLILVLVVLFLQWRPSGLFAMKGRQAET